MPYKDPEIQRQKQREHYQKNRDRYIEALRRNRKKAKDKLDDYKKTLKCETCGESRTECLDFHHKDPALKDVTISRALTNRWSWNRLKIEVSKCIVLCANCHRVIHANPFPR